MKFIVSIGYTTETSPAIRSTSILVDAKDVADAKKQAVEHAGKMYEWHKINSVKPA